MDITVAVTGASGAIYARRMVELLAASAEIETINLIISSTAAIVAQVELGIDLKNLDKAKIAFWLGNEDAGKKIRVWRLDNLAAKPSSGSYKQAGMVIVPCSVASIGAIASGAGTNLIHRAADVCLKEGRKLVIVPRETPLNSIHLENMLKLSQAGARILPASPSFYQKPTSIADLVDHICYRILDQFDLSHSSATEWQGLEPGEHV